MHVRWRGLELPSLVNCDAATLSGTYGKFVAEPFERGFGVTVGNSLRRVLLSSLEGSAVTLNIKIRGAQHEFTTIPGVLEDVTDIVLNVKVPLSRIIAIRPASSPSKRTPPASSPVPMCRPIPMLRSSTRITSSAR